jgi:hypothetical protein
MPHYQAGLTRAMGRPCPVRMRAAALFEKFFQKELREYKK